LTRILRNIKQHQKSGINGGVSIEKCAAASLMPNLEGVAAEREAALRKKMARLGCGGHVKKKSEK